MIRARLFFIPVIRNGVPQLVGTGPLRTGTAVHVLPCTWHLFIFAHPDASFSLFRDHGRDFRDMSKCDNI